MRSTNRTSRRNSRRQTDISNERGSRRASLRQKAASSGRRSHRSQSDEKLLAPLVRESWAERPAYLTMAINDVGVDAELSPRTGINEAVVAALQEALGGGCRLPPITVFEIDNVVTVADGLQRIEAHKRHGSFEIEVELRVGTAEDATLFAIHSNAPHGTRLSRDELRTAIGKMLDDPEAHLRSNAEIAEFCGCSPPTVAKLRKKHPLTQKLLSDQTRLRRTPRGGRSAMKVSNMGRRPSRREHDEDRPARSVREPVPARDHGTVVVSRGKDTVDLFLDRLDELQTHWNDPEALGTAVADNGERRMRRRFEACLTWFDAMAAAYRGSKANNARVGKDQPE